MTLPPPTPTPPHTQDSLPGLCGLCSLGSQGPLVGLLSLTLQGRKRRCRMSTSSRIRTDKERRLISAGGGFSAQPQPPPVGSCTPCGSAREMLSRCPAAGPEPPVSHATPREGNTRAALLVGKAQSPQPHPLGGDPPHTHTPEDPRRLSPGRSWGSWRRGGEQSCSRATDAQSGQNVPQTSTLSPPYLPSIPFSHLS